MTRAAALALVACAGPIATIGAAGAAEPGASLLAGREPERASGIHGASRMTDGVAAGEGAFWKTELSARWSGADAYAVFDLGAVQPITAAWLQGDHNDSYRLETSADGRSFVTLWEATPVGGGGLRERRVTGLAGSGRYLRITASGGDGAYALAELQVFAQAPASMPASVERRDAPRLEQAIRDRMLVFGLACMLIVALGHRGMRRAWLGVLLLAAAVAAVRVILVVREAWPLEPREISLGRAVIASIATLALLRALWQRRPAHDRVLLGALGVCGVLGVSAFYGFGRPQFFDLGTSQWTFAHQLDLRQYYPTAKYFRELGYRRLYEADVAAYLEADGGHPLATVLHRPMRSLRTFSVDTVDTHRDEVATIKNRFTPERWQEYREDVAFFRKSMGTELYLDTMRDFGANATPVWMSIAHVLFSLIRPGNIAFTITGFVDLLLMALAFAFIGRAYGLRTAFAAMVLFGCNDFVMFGTNWAGSTLRHDWLAYLGIGAALLKMQRWFWGGAVLMLSAMIRAFPVFAVAAAVLPGLWQVVDRLLRERRLPDRRTLVADLGPGLRIAAGAVAAALALFAFSAIVLPPSAWPEWFVKAGKLNADPHVAHVTLRTLLGGAGADQMDIIQSRGALWLAAVAVFVGLVLRAGRTCRPDEAAILGMILCPILLYPASYYMHFIYVLPLLMDERGRAPLTPSGIFIGALAVGLCAAQYFAVLVPDFGLHFYIGSALLLTVLLAVLAIMNGRGAVDRAIVAAQAPTG